MTVKQLMDELAKMPPDAEVEIQIGDPNDTAYTNEVVHVGEQAVNGAKNGRVEIRGWVSSDSDEAFSPWSSC